MIPLKYRSSRYRFHFHKNVMSKTFPSLTEKPSPAKSSVSNVKMTHCEKVKML